MKTVYAHDGRVLQVISCPQSSLVGVLDREDVAGVIDGYFDDADYYILNYEATLRPDNPATLTSSTIAASGEDTISLTNLPDPCTITYTGPGFELTGEATGGTAEFTTDAAGEHKIKVEAWPYLDWEGTFNAV